VRTRAWLRRFARTPKEANMKHALALPILGLALGLTTPVNAAALNGVVTDSAAQIVDQQTKCKEGEKWDEKLKKCVKIQ